MIFDAPIGTFVNSLPVPHDPSLTDYFPAGALTIGVEYRVFDPEVERLKFSEEELAATGPDSLFNRPGSDQGVSLHVFATDGLSEYLRFDCFNDEPHYHYIRPKVGNMLVHFDPSSNGLMLDWALAAIRHRLTPMLESIGAEELARAVDTDLLTAAMDAAEPIARHKAAAPTPAA